MSRLLMRTLPTSPALQSSRGRMLVPPARWQALLTMMTTGTLPVRGRGQGLSRGALLSLQRRCRALWQSGLRLPAAVNHACRCWGSLPHLPMRSLRWWLQTGTNGSSARTGCRRRPEGWRGDFRHPSRAWAYQAWTRSCAAARVRCARPSPRPWAGTCSFRSWDPSRSRRAASRSARSQPRRASAARLRWLMRTGRFSSLARRQPQQRRHRWTHSQALVAVMCFCRP
mmetsp:Transcript_88612/g.251184  ORF Transcript_88612/g.251184 Transcript_88612/m.251184 type:complete len:227 (-) Transcript_88612:439-1119(-)